MTFDRAARIAAGAIAAVAWFGLAVQFASTLGQTGSVPATLWFMFRYFTIVANLLVAVTFTFVAAGRPRHSAPSRVGGVTIAIVLVGTVYFLILHGTLELSGGAKLANVITHGVVPVLVPLYWIVFVPRGSLRHRDPMIWAMLPIAYLAYALVRGQAESSYPYPFIDVGEIGWWRTAANAAMIAAAFLLFGFAMVWLDRLLHRPSRAAPRRGDDTG